jgi:hypothetical protein
VENKKDGDEGTDHRCERFTEHQEKHFVERRIGISCSPHGVDHCPHHDVSAKSRVEDEEEEVLVIPVTYTVVDPWAVMIHLENAHSAYAAVMTSVGLKLCTPFAISTIARALDLVHIQSFT